MARLFLATLAAVALLGQLPLTPAACAERPVSMSLFPGETVLYVRTADAGLLLDRVKRMGMVRMTQDPTVAPLVNSLMDSAQDAYSQNAEAGLGVTLDSLLNLPQGELAFGLVERAGESAAMLLLADFGAAVSTAETLLEQAKQRIEQDGGLVGEEQLRADKAMTLRTGNDSQNVIGVVRREGVFVASNDPALLQSVLDHWDGVTPTGSGAASSDDAGASAPRYTKTLAKNPRFANSLEQCLAGRDEPPQLIAFVDPIALVRATAGTSTSVRLTLATLPALGVDKFEGISAAAWFSNDTWDLLARAHLMIDNPRTGVAGVLRLKDGDTTPPECVPAEVVNYRTLYVNPEQIFGDVRALVDRFSYEGMFEGQVKQAVSNVIGVDFVSEVLPLLSGRVSTISAFEAGANTAAPGTMVILGVNDERAAAALLDKAMQTPGTIQSAFPAINEFGGVEYFGPLDGDRGSEEPAPEVAGRRGPPLTPVATVLGDALIIGSSEGVLKAMIEASKGAVPRLRDSLEFKLVQSRVRRMANGNEVGMLSYADSKQSLRRWLQLADSPEIRDQLAQANNGIGGALTEALDSGGVPPVEALLRYATPSGGLVYDTGGGLHYISFQFKAPE